MSESLVKIEGHEMLKAQYNFEATLAKTLSFNEGDYFILHQSINKQRNWWQVVNIQGQLGFVPSNYVSPVKVEPLFMIKFIEECVARMNDGTQLTSDKQELITKLNEKRNEAEIALKPYIKKQAPQPPELNHGLTNGRSHPPPAASPIPEGRSGVATPSQEPPLAGIKIQHNNHSEDNGYENLQDVVGGSQLHIATRSPSPGGRSPQRSQSSPSVAAGAGPGEHSAAHMAAVLYSMVERVRTHTRLSHDMSRVAVTTVLDSLKEVLERGRCAPVWTLSSLASGAGPLAAERATLRSTSDARRLRSDLSALAACAQDAQQRAWALHDDEHTIANHLTEVVSVLSNADVRVSCDVLSTENYEYVSALVLFYQMETRWHIRQLLIRAFGVMCSLDREIVKVLCSSVLARELARDMLANQSHAERLSASANLLTTMLSMADPLPLSHFEQLDMEFVSFLLEWIESPPESDVEDHIPDDFLATVLALNLQFTDQDNNLILDGLQTRSHSKVFTEKLLLLLNREDDPVRVLEFIPAAPHSVLKLSLDTFSRRTTASLFYTNDTKVLLDITVRQLADLSAGDQRRALYLQLCLGVLRHTDYSHGHRQADLLRCFTRIFCEEGESSKADQNLVRTISNEFPQYFKA